jgi:hypothetical protein
VIGEGGARVVAQQTDVPAVKKREKPKRMILRRLDLMVVPLLAPYP